MPQDRTIRDFGVQWRHHKDNVGYYGSPAMLADILGDLLPVEELRGARIADIGSGTGRIVNMLLDAEAAEVVAIEPSEAFKVLKENTVERHDRVCYLKARGEAVASERDLDFVIAVGVLHHIVDPLPVAKAAFAALRPGGRFIAWFYGHEGNETYLRVVIPLRRLTSKLPHPVLAGLCGCLNFAVDGYIILCRLLPLPLPQKNYVKNVLSKLSRAQRQLVIYDQLNPAYAKYYRREDAERLFREAGFTDMRLDHRHGYSWTVIGSKPEPKVQIR